MGIENFEIKSDADLRAEIAAREERLTDLRAKIEAGTATDEDKREVALANQLEAQRDIKKSFEEKKDKVNTEENRVD